jgi:hypothetical protein
MKSKNPIYAENRWKMFLEGYLRASGIAWSIGDFAGNAQRM